MAVTLPPTDAEGGPTIYQPLDSEVRSALDPEFVSFYDKYMQYVEPDDVRPWDAIKTRKRVPFPSGTSQPVEVCQIKDFELDNFPIRVFWACGERPASGWPVLVWYHGGGWAIGSIESENDFCTRMCRDAMCVVVTVGYRLAPEYPYPTPVEDALDALKWVYSETGRQTLEIDHRRIAIGGTSAGGNLSVVTSLKASLLSTPIPIAFQILIVPVIDNTATVSTIWSSRAHAPWLTPSRMSWYRRMYLPDSARGSEWSASPNLAPDEVLSRSPKTWVAVADQDLLSPEALAFAEQLRDLQVEVEVKRYPGMPHNILAMNGILSKGAQLVNDAGRVLRTAFEQLAPTP